MTPQEALDRLTVFPLAAERREPDWTPDKRALDALASLQTRIMILAPARSGSEYLCGMLAGLGIDAREYFNPDSNTADGAAIGKTEDEAGFVSRLCQSVPNRILCVKGGVHRMTLLFRLGELPENAGAWRFVAMRRRNRVLQAISALAALRTGSWRSDQGRGQPLSDADLGFTAVTRMIDQIYRTEDAIVRFCDLLDVQPLWIDYESLVAQPGVWLERFAAHSGLEGDRCPAPTRPMPRVQRTSFSTRIEHAYRAELSRCLTTGDAPREEFAKALA